MTNDLAPLRDWDGEIDQFARAEDTLSHEAELCDHVFEAKREGFAAGFTLGHRQSAPRDGAGGDEAAG